MSNKCTSCGLCCKLFLINLSEKEYKSGTFKTFFRGLKEFNNFNQVKSVGGNILAQKKDGSCIYLENQLCTIHKTRPLVCRKFFCTSKNKKFKEMVKIIDKHKSYAL